MAYDALNTSDTLFNNSQNTCEGGMGGGGGGVREIVAVTLLCTG